MLGVDAAPSGPAPTPGMKLWVKGSAGLFTSPGVWSDQSGFGHDLVVPGGGVSPTAGAGINGFPTAEFDGSTQYLHTSVAASNLITTTVFSIYVVMKYTGTNGKLGPQFTPCILIDDSEQLGIFTYLAAGAGDVWGTCTAAANTGSVNGPFTVGNPQRLSFLQAGVTVSGNQQLLRIKGVSDVTQDGVTIAGALASPLDVGFYVTAGVPGFSTFKGSIGEILIYDFALSGPQQTATEAYLDGAWGL